MENLDHHFIKKHESLLLELERQDHRPCRWTNPRWTNPRSNPTKQRIRKLERTPEDQIQDEQKDRGNVRSTAEAKKTVEKLKRVLSQLLVSLSTQLDQFADFELKRIQQHAVDVTLDPDTAHPQLVLSPDGKRVRHEDGGQTVLPNPDRFDFCACVLGKQGFSSGTFYYEVQVSEKTKWDVGVARESANRNGPIITSPKNGYWTVWLRNKNKYEACDSPPVPLSLTRPPQKVGVFVDYDEGLVSFYDVDAKSHIYSFTAQTFTERLYPFFSPSRNHGGKNSAPLILSPVQPST